LNPELDRDLETLCLKCLEKVPARRYPTAESLADDLARWRRREPILARPATSWQRGVKWVQRNPVVAGLIALLTVALAGGFLATHWQLRRAERALAVNRELTAHRNAKLAQELLAQDKVNEALTLLASEVRHEPLDSGASARLLMALSQRDFPILLGAPIQHGAEVNSACFSPDGRFLATSSADRTARVSDAATGKPVLAELRHADEVEWVTFSPDGRTGQLLAPPLEHESSVWLAGFDRSNRFVLTVTDGSPANRREKDKAVALHALCFGEAGIQRGLRLGEHAGND
jgi:hypothetical protein